METASSRISAWFALSILSDDNYHVTIAFWVNIIDKSDTL